MKKCNQKNKAIDFLIFYEVEVRELESIFMLGNELTNRGYNVEYLSFDHVSLNNYLANKKFIKKFFNNVKVALMPSLYHNKEIINIVYYVCGKCTQIINLRWEQFFVNGSMESCTSAEFPKEGALSAYHLCWGKESYSSLIKCGVEEDKLLLDGALQLDVLCDGFDSYFYDKNDLFGMFDIPVDKDNFLFISSFAISTMSDRDIIQQDKNLDSVNVLDSDLVKISRDSYYIFLDWIESFLQTYPEIVFIYRPHPAEKITNTLLDIQKKYNNFYVISELSVKQWIHVCKNVITWYSTSIAEAYFAGRECTTVRPLPIPYEQDVPFYNGCAFVTDKDEFLNILYVDRKTTLSNEQMENCYLFKKNEPTFLRMTASLEKIINSNESFHWDEELIEEFENNRKKYAIKSIIMKFYIAIIKLLCRIYKKTGISFGMRDRIERYLYSNVTKTDKIKSERYFCDTKLRIDVLMNSYRLKKDNGKN